MRGKQDRQKKRWEDYIRERTGLEFGVRQVPEGSGQQGKWRKLVAK